MQRRRREESSPGAVSFNQRHYIPSERTVLNKRDRLNYEDIWRTTEAAVPSNRAHLGSLYVGAKASDLHTEPPLILSFSLISRINHRAAALLPSSFSPPPPHSLSHSLFQSLILSLPLYACPNGRQDTGAHASAGRNIISSGRNSGARPVPSRFNDRANERLYPSVQIPRPRCHRDRFRVLKRH